LRMSGVELGQRGHLWPILEIIVTLAIALNGGRVGSNLVMDAHFGPKRMPVDAVNYLEEHEVRGPILSPDYWGGYLIYRLYPRVRVVVVDDRHDLYGAEFLRSYLQMMHVEQGWDEFLREHEPGCVLLPRDAALANILRKMPDWQTIYTDDVSVALVHGTDGPRNLHAEDFRGRAAAGIRTSN
jgi:hypothetical protein